MTLYQSEAQLSWLLTLSNAPIPEEEAETSVPVVPTISTASTRPPRGPRPLRWVTSTAASLPTEGKALSTALTGTDAHHLWHGLHV